MSLNGYDSAFEQATNERAEIRIEIERLLNRGEMLDKLLECLAPFVSSPQPVEEANEPAAVAETEVQETAEAPTVEAAAEAPAAEEAPVAEVQEVQEEQHEQVEQQELQEQTQG